MLLIIRPKSQGTKKVHQKGSDEMETRKMKKLEGGEGINLLPFLCRPIDWGYID